MADSHLDGDVRINGKIILGPHGRNIRAEDRLRCFRSAIQEAIKRGCHLVLHSGDLFERNRPTPAEYCAAQEILDELAAARIPCIIIADNHGAVESAAERHAIEPLAGRPGLRTSIRPEVFWIETDAGPVQIATLPSPRHSVVASKDECKGLSPEAVNGLISEKLRAIIRDFRARLDPSGPAILMFHGKIIGAWLNDLQQATGFDQVALTPEDFAGWDYVALGDFHGCQQVAPNAWYAGATDRTSFNEERQAKGWLLVTMPADPRTTYELGVELIETPARRYFTLGPEDLSEDVLTSARKHAEDLERCPIYRLKGRMTQQDYDALQPLLARWREIPTFGEELEISRQTTARSREMTSGLSEEGALRLWHEANKRPEDLATLLGEHRRIAEVAR